MTPEALAALRVVTALAAQPVKAVVITSTKDRIFIAGADLKWMAQMPDPATASAISREGQAVFQQLADFAVPVVCALNGATAGGALSSRLPVTGASRAMPRRPRQACPRPPWGPFPVGVVA